jgi:hypothetical protein
MIMQNQKPKYQIRIDELDKYSWKALVADLTVEPPSATSIMAKSLHELMAKVLVAVTLRDKNLGVEESHGTIPDLPQGGETNPGDNGKPIILTPNKRIIAPN